MNIFTIYCNPIPWKRSRHKGKKHFDTQVKEKKAFILSIKNQIPEKFKPLSKNVEVRLEFHMPIPKSLSKKKQREIEGEFHEKKPDLSNLIKFVEDTFNGILWVDDSKISYMFSSKRYSSEPRTMIYVTEHHV